MRKIKIFKGAAIEYDEELEKKGIAVSTNTGEPVEIVEANEKNRKKYIHDKKYPPKD